MDNGDKYENFRKIASGGDAAWIKRKRKINTEILITEIARGKANRLGLRQIAYQSNSTISASALVQAKQRIPVTVLSTVLTKLNSSMSTGQRILAIDSSKVNLPVRFVAEGVMPRNEAAKKPLIMCSTLFDVKLDVPLDVVVADHHNERKCLVDEHSHQLHAGDLIIGDRGYFSRDVCLKLQTKRVDVLFRVKERACREVMSFVASRRRDRIIDLDGLRVRCFKYTLCDQRYVLLTTDLNLTLCAARTIYKARWRIEEGFRRWKSDFNLCKNTAHSLHTFKVDVMIVAIAHTLVRSSLSVTSVRADVSQVDRPDMTLQAVRAFRACALALFATSSQLQWRQSGVWIPTRRPNLET